MKRLLQWPLPIILLIAAGIAGAQGINFDDVPDATDISTHYSGLTFSCAGSHCTNPSIFARQTPMPFSAQNTVSTTKTGMAGVHNPTTGTIRVGIACLATKVSVQARSIQVPEPLNQVQHAILVAQDANGNSVGQATGTKFDQWELLTVSSPTNLIPTIVLGVEGTGEAGVGQFDDLTIECAPHARPWIWWLMAMIAIASGIFYWRRRQNPVIP